MGMGLSEIVAWNMVGSLDSAPGKVTVGEQLARTAARETLASRALPGFVMRNGMMILFVLGLV
jgi:hypothetical protein